MSDVYTELNRIQQNLNAPKNQFNKFGKYNYRNCDDILQAVKPLLNGGLILINDEMVEVGGHIYVKAIAEFVFDGKSISTTAYAKEAVMQKGMSEAQITGSTSSYARKYALNGLLLIDDNKDADSRDNSSEGTIPHPNSKEAKEAKQIARENHPVVPIIAGYLAEESQWDLAREALAEITDEEEKKAIWKLFNSKEKEIIQKLKVL